MVLTQYLRMEVLSRIVLMADHMKQIVSDYLIWQRIVNILSGQTRAII